MLFVLILISLVSAVIGAMMAGNRNRNPLTWAIICFLIPLIGIVILAAIETTEGPGLKADDRKRWETLIEVDKDIAAAAAKARAVDPECERVLAEKYLVLNEKKYLSSLLKSTLKQFEETDDATSERPFADEISQLEALAADGLISRDEMLHRITQLTKRENLASG